MPHTTEPTLLVMHTLRIKGLAEPAEIALATGRPEPEVITIVEQLAGDDHARRRDGRMSGWSLTPEGKALHLQRIAEERAAADAETALEVAYQEFVHINDRFKTLCTDWQLRMVGGEMVLNDHADADYDAAIATRLSEIHDEAASLLCDLAAQVPRFTGYSGRLGAAVAQFIAGDRHALAKPLSASYHDVWMELHQDLLLSLGRDRSDADGH